MIFCLEIHGEKNTDNASTPPPPKPVILSGKQIYQLRKNIFFTLKLNKKTHQFSPLCLIKNKFSSIKG